MQVSLWANNNEKRDFCIKYLFKLYSNRQLAAYMIQIKVSVDFFHCGREYYNAYYVMILMDLYLCYIHGSNTLL